MKKYFSVLFAGLAVAGVLSGCSDDDFGNGQDGNKPSAGNTVNFTLGGPTTRTVYDDEDEYQINWTEGDQVRIYCNEAEDVKQADYSVIKSIDPDAENTGTLRYNENGLAWGSESTHNFFAVYPADDSKVSVENGIATFQFNQNQVCTFPTSADSEGNYMGTPDMTNAYMVAHLSTTPIDEVPLHFSPIMTTLQITVKGRAQTTDQDVVVTGISIINDNVTSTDAQNGQFQYDITNSTIVNSESTSTPTTETTFVRARSGTNSFITLASGQSATFTVFLPPLPVDGNNIITVRVHATGETEHSVTIGGTEQQGCVTANGTPVTYPASSKGHLTLAYFPTEQTGNNWITPLDDGIYVSQLSIPGTHDSGAWQMTGLVGSAGKTQDYTIAKQLEMGIRAFDLRPTCPNAGNASAGRNPRLPIYHGIVDCSDINAFQEGEEVSLVTAFEDFNAYLNKNPDEFIIAIVRWENEGDPHVDYINPLGGRKWDIFQKSMTNFLNNASYYPQARRVEFKPDLTVSDLRGKILIINRPCQGSDPDEFYAKTALTGTTFISGWPAGSADVRTNVFFKQQYEGAANGYAVVQDYYNVENSTTKQNLIKQELDMSAQSHTNAEYKNTWFINHCSGYSGAVSSDASYSNNAAAVNPAIFEYLTSDSKTPGSTGIMMLDFVGKRVSDASGMTVWGDLLPQAIIDNNYKYRPQRRGE